MSDDDFSVDTIEKPDRQGLLRFALIEAATDEECVAGLLAPYADPFNTGHYVASTRLPLDTVLPEDCHPRLALVTLEPSQPPDSDTLLAAVTASYEAADRQAWHTWIQHEAAAGRLPQTVVEALNGS